MLDEKLTAPGHDNMRLDDLRRRPAERRGGGRFHIGGGLEAVPPEHHDLVPGPGQQQPGEQARGTAPSDGDVQRVLPCVLGRTSAWYRHQGKAAGSSPAEENASQRRHAPADCLPSDDRALLRRLPTADHGILVLDFSRSRGAVERG